MVSVEDDYKYKIYLVKLYILCVYSYFLLKMNDFIFLFLRRCLIC